MNLEFVFVHCLKANKRKRSGETVPALWLALSFGGALLLGLILAAIAATLYNRPKLIFTSG